MADLLYEIGTEELPAGYIEPALQQLAALAGRLLQDSRLSAASIRTAGTPRRLVLAASGIPDRQRPVVVKSIGPPARAAFDSSGAPTAAALGFARSKGVPPEALKVEQTPKGPYVVAEVEERGKNAAEVLPELLVRATAGISFPKSMRWEPSGFQFARPIRRLVALLDEEVLPVSLAGLRAGRITAGHPFLAPGPIELKNASFENYLALLRDAFVIADPAERRDATRKQVNELLGRHGARLQDEELLAEVANMVEHPHAVEGEFDPEFLSVPAPVLRAAMREHQRYFHVSDAEGRLLARFVTVCDRTPGQDATVREGNERVLRARLEDARFFWEEDSRRGLEELVPKLAQVVFLGGLGNNLQRQERLAELASKIAERAGDADLRRRVRRAAGLCKADLLTGLVGEFPGLQGVVGREIALAQGEDPRVAAAIAEHYMPTGADGELPESPEGTALALADKMDTIVGCFSIGLLPSGSQDPYALRRNALGVLLMLERERTGLGVGELVEMARATCREHGIECDDDAAARILDFFRDRLYNAAIERGFRHDFVRAVLAAGHEDVRGFWARLDALVECSRRAWWPALVELVDRTYRIQRDAEGIGPVSDELLREPLEKALASALKEHAGAVTAAFAQGDYVGAAERYCAVFARLVHEFFDEVFVNVEDERLRHNRKSLCAQVYHLFADSFADLYLIESAETVG